MAQILNAVKSSILKNSTRLALTRLTADAGDQPGGKLPSDVRQ